MGEHLVMDKGEVPIIAPISLTPEMEKEQDEIINKVAEMHDLKLEQDGIKNSSD